MGPNTNIIFNVTVFVSSNIATKQKHKMHTNMTAKILIFYGEALGHFASPSSNNVLYIAQERLFL